MPRKKASKKRRPKATLVRRGPGGQFAATPPPDAAAVAATEAAEYFGIGKSQVAVASRRRRIVHLVLRNRTVAQIAEETGLAPRYISETLQEVQRRNQEELSTWDLHVDAAQQRLEFAEYRAMILEGMDTVGFANPAWNRLMRMLLQLKLVEQRFMEKAGLRRELDAGAPPDISDLRGLPSERIEEELAIITNHLGRRVTGRGWRRSVQRMIEGEIVEVADLPDPEAEEPDH
jgi:hypothetical protein